LHLHMSPHAPLYCVRHEQQLCVPIGHLTFTLAGYLEVCSRLVVQAEFHVKESGWPVDEW
jgi:hypothetical protein